MTEIDIILQSKSMDWFLYDIVLRHESINLNEINVWRVLNLRNVL